MIDTYLVHETHIEYKGRDLLVCFKYYLKDGYIKIDHVMDGSKNIKRECDMEEVRELIEMSYVNS